MKKSFAVVLTGLVISLVLAGPARADKGPVVYDQARAIPTKSGENVRITIYTRYVKRVKVRVDDSDAMKGIRFGKGCGKLRCDKWKIYAVRGESECHKLKITGSGRRGERFVADPITVCEPFRGGEV
ncbi:MAG TPA: hypothetical protein VMF31_09915 [Solirubrobacterales bacterium]|nr:hypothetical protein [Solirubrobacterales bacterium]